MKKCLLTILLFVTLSSGCSLLVDGAIKRDISANYAVVKSYNDLVRQGAANPQDGIEILKKLERSLETWVDYCYGKKPAEVKE